MKNVFYLSIVLIVVILLAGSCQHEPLFEDFPIIENPIDTTGNNNGGNGDIPCSPDSVYFQNKVMPILQSNCAFSGCHGDGSAQDGVDLTTYSSIMNTADVRPFDLDGSDLYEVITETDPDKIMPPPPNNPLSSDQIAAIALWINQGALDNGCDSCDTTNVTFSQVISPMIQNNCQGCHSGNSPSAGISLTNHAQIQEQAFNGALLGVINHASGYEPMPQNQPKLSQCKIDQINIWINDGALDN